jgi:VCBS repeat-containing protein
LGAISAGAALAQDRPIDFSSRGANVFSAPGVQSLSLPSQAAPAAVVATFLNSQGHLPETVASLAVTSKGRVSRTGITHLRFAQEVAGLTVYGTYVKAAVNDDGELVHLIENLATPIPGGLLPTAIGEQAALDAALDEVHPGVSVTLIRGPRDGNTTRFSGDAFFYQDPTVTRVAIPMESGVLQEGYLVETWTEEANLLHHTLIDGTGQVLQVELRTNNDSYFIFPDFPNPSSSNQIVTPGPGIGSVASPAVPESPIGWLNLEPGGTTLTPQSSIDISGNNAHAYLDVDKNNTPDPSIDFLITDGDFLTAVQPAQQPNTLVNQEVAVQNLFYFNNVIHDKLYFHGFDEAAGNFQEDNFGNGGLGSDSVNAEAQDGGGTNNANFSTPSDGSNSRMQMYLWNPPGFSLEIAGGATYDAVPALFGPSPTDGLTDDVVVAIDGTAPTSDGCEAIGNVAGKIALIDRGLCDFVVKVQNAQTAGAVGVIVANNVLAAISGMADNGDGHNITIPSLFIGLSDGNAIKTLLAGGGVTATLDATHVMKDGDVDSDIIWHEYGHGLTWRMIGGMGTTMSGAIGEGMSDVLAILINNQDTVGEYATGNPVGIRTAPYTNYPRTYGNFIGTSVHFNGEIYAATIWHLWELFQAAGISQDTLFDYLIGGMNFTPSGPAFEDMRDGILTAANGTGHECLIWQAFAAFGVGTTANYNGGSNVTESFAVPAEYSGGCDTSNFPPVAEDDGPYGVAEGGAVVVIVADGVLDNDTDSDGPLALTAVLPNGPSNGVLTLNPDGSFSYTHDGGETASDSFTYRAYDGVSYSSPATVSIIVTPVNDPPVAVDNSYTTTEGVPVGGNVLTDDTGEGLDSDPENNALSVSTITLPSTGILTGDVVGADGSFTYTPNPGVTGDDTFTYTVIDGNGGADVATVTITITGTSTVPDAVDDPVAVAAHQWIDIDVLTNDSDPEGDLLTVTQVSTPTSFGEVSINGDNTLHYRRHKRFGNDACDAFTYTISDGNGGVDTANVYVTVGTPAEDCGGGVVEPPPPDPADSGSVKGTVRDSSGTRLGGVVVTIDTDDPDPSASSNNGGKYNIADVDVSTTNWPVIAIKADYCMADPSLSVAVSDGVTTTLNIVMNNDPCP